MILCTYIIGGMKMAINMETQINASVVLDREVYARLKNFAKRNKRSVSAQIAFWVEEKLKEETLVEMK
jgi:hypothetical protein